MVVKKNYYKIVYPTLKQSQSTKNLQKPNKQSLRATGFIQIYNNIPPKSQLHKRNALIQNFQKLAQFQLAKQKSLTAQLNNYYQKGYLSSRFKGGTSKFLSKQPQSVQQQKQEIIQGFQAFSSKQKTKQKPEKPRFLQKPHRSNKGFIKYVYPQLPKEISTQNIRNAPIKHLQVSISPSQLEVRERLENQQLRKLSSQERNLIKQRVNLRVSSLKQILSEKSKINQRNQKKIVPTHINILRQTYQNLPKIRQEFKIAYHDQTLKLLQSKKRNKAQILRKNLIGLSERQRMEWKHQKQQEILNSLQNELVNENRKREQLIRTASAQKLVVRQDAQLQNFIDYSTSLVNNELSNYKIIPVNSLI